MTDPKPERSLAFVAPERRALVKARIAVLEAHRAIARPTVEDADRAAASLGMTRISFYRLLRAWNAGRDPAAMGVIGGPRGPSGRRAHPGDAFVEQALSRLKAGRPLHHDVAAIEAAADEAGVTIRSRTSLRLMVKEIRAAEPAPSDVEDVFVDHAVVEIPVDGPDGPTMPLASVLGCKREGRILAVRLSLDVPGPAVAAALLIHAIKVLGIERRTENRRGSIAVDADFRSEWRRLFATLASHGVDRTGEERRVQRSGRPGGALVYPHLLGLRAHTRLAERGATERRPRLRARSDRVLTLEEAQRAVEERVAATSTGTPLRLGTDLDALVADLRTFR